MRVILIKKGSYSIIHNCQLMSFYTGEETEIPETVFQQMQHKEYFTVACQANNSPKNSLPAEENTPPADLIKPVNSGKRGRRKATITKEKKEA